MYKKLSYPQLLQLKSKFFENLKYIVHKQKCNTLKEYLTVIGKTGGDSVYHMQKQDYIRRTVFVHDSGQIVFFDEKEKIELHADNVIISKIQSLISDKKKLKSQTESSESIEQTLQKAFEDGELASIGGKNYLVYDIETSYATNDIKGIQFYMGYAYLVQKGKGVYKYLEDENMEKFVNFMLDFDGYIVGYNSIAFDNPVSLYHVLKSDFNQEEYDQKLEILNKKSLDIFQFVRNITGKRMGLNKLSRALVGLGKTLESGKEGENLWKLYRDGDEQALKTLKNYCKNDVKMTYLSLWYILLYKKLSLEGEDFEYSVNNFLELSNIEKKEELFGQDKSDSGSLF